MKYNRSEIMKNAWALVKEDHISISIALKAAWALAKAMKEADAVRDVCEAGYSGHSKVSVNDWKKYGRHLHHCPRLDQRVEPQA